MVQEECKYRCALPLPGPLVVINFATVQRRAAEDLEAMEKRAVMAESMLEAIEKQAAEEMRAMEKRAVMAESMLEATLDFHAGAAPRNKRSMDPKLKGDESKDNSRFHNHTNSKYFLDAL